jgi:hypothetical protein
LLQQKLVGWMQEFEEAQEAIATVNGDSVEERRST